MEHKTFPTASTKVIDEGKGIVEHVITVFGVLDLVKDISHPGSWTKTLAERGDKLLVLDMHNTDSINRAIGTPVSVREVGRNELPSEVLADYPEATGGIVAQTQFLMDTPEGKGAYIRLREKAVREWSYGYDALDTDRSVVKDKEGGDVNVRNLRTVKVYEYGPVLWGACPGTMVTDVKEGKPAPEVTENTIRIRVRAPGDFQEDSFRTITIGDEDDGIQAVIGRLEGETTTTTQSFVFDKEKFTTAEAQVWVDEHEKQVIPVIHTGELKGVNEWPDCGYEVANEEHCRDLKCLECGGELQKGVTGAMEEHIPVGEEVHSIVPRWDEAEKAVVRKAFEAQYKTPSDPSRYWIVAAHDEHIIVQHENTVDGIEFYQVGYTKTDEIIFTPQGEWIGGEYVFMSHGTEEKAVDLTQYVADVRTAFESQYNSPNDLWRYWVMAVYDEYIIVQDNEGDGVGFYQVGYTKTEDSITFTPQGEWIGGEYIFVPHGTEGKAGRVLAGRNETRIVSALLTLIDVLEDAGIELPGFEKNPVIIIPEEEAAAPVGQAADDKAGPTEESPTLTELVRREEAKNLVDWLKEQVELLATLSKEVS